ncbi:hypothetical protein QSJ19_03665 [Gordonia sp. ABSL11-1]|uniref:hypothetical protein n=1 Tax=Gordonia sp. ABSL11-1 TaxID=3053924 RepID=UPI002572C90B|nr:hypothetical protein [Gordonia sp. ABSL11-1]MDL9944691.1 hypothetical protein [Gordonia sp. ABSL11-1]
MSVIPCLRRPWATAALALTVIGSSLAAGVATAEPAVEPSQLPVAGAPVPTSDGEYSYIATHAVTQRAATMKAPEAIASLPVPQQYRPANLALAAQFDIALQSALAAPGGCVQIVVDPRSRSGNLFNYGFFPVVGKYCP